MAVQQCNRGVRHVPIEHDVIDITGVVYEERVLSKMKGFVA